MDAWAILDLWPTHCQAPGAQERDLSVPERQSPCLHFSKMGTLMPCATKVLFVLNLTVGYVKQF